MDRNTVALVNGKVIDKAALERAERPWAELDLSNERKLFFRRKAIDQLIDETLVLEEARRSGLTVPDEELEKELRNLKSDYPGRLFDEMLIREYVNPDEWRERVRKNLLIGKITEVQIRERRRLDTVEWEAFFRKRLQEETGQIRLKAVHISFANRENAEEALNRIKSGQDLEKVAQDLAARDSSAVIGAPVWIDPGASDSPLTKTLSSLADGESSDILKTKLGFSIFQVIESDRNRRVDPRQFLIETQKEFFTRQRAKAYSDWLKELRAVSGISVNPLYSKMEEGRNMNEQKVDN